MSGRPAADGSWSAVERVTIANLKGLHARAAAKFVKTANAFKAEVVVRKNDTEVSGASIMGLMMLAASRGCELEVRARGREAHSVMAALVKLVNDKFQED